MPHEKSYKKLFLHTKSDCKKSADTKRLCRNRKEVSGMETIMKERKLTEWGNIWINEKYFMRAYQALNRLDLETRKEAIEIATK